MNRPVKKRNHQVTRSLLSGWQSKREGKPGIFSYDLIKQETQFSQGAAASFAIVDYLYAPVQMDGLRNDDLENEFSFDESDLAKFLKKIERGDKEKLSDKLVRKAIKACVSLGFRNTYYVASLMAHLEQEGAHPNDLHRLAIEQVKRTLRLKYAMFETWRFMVVRNLPADLLVNEQPFRDWTIHKVPAEIVTMVLGPRTMLLGCPSPYKKFELAWAEADQVPINVANHNGFVIETARHFVAAKSKEQLDAVIPELTSELVKERMEKDRLVTARFSLPFPLDDADSPA